MQSPSGFTRTVPQATNGYFYGQRDQNQNQSQNQLQRDTQMRDVGRTTQETSKDTQAKEIADFMVINPDGTTYLLKIIGTGTIRSQEIQGLGLQQPKIISLGTKRE